jgi:hypothetical protein
LFLFLLLQIFFEHFIIIEQALWGRSSVGSSKQAACEIENKALSNWQKD